MDGVIVGEGTCQANTIERAIRDCRSSPVLLQNWRRFAHNLEVNEAEVLNLGRKLNLGIVELADLPGEIIRIWKAAKGSAATLKVLCDALVDSDTKDIAEFLEGKFVT